MKPSHCVFPILAFGLSILVPKAPSQSLNITTLAGLGGSYGDADGTGESARFRWPTGVAVDAAGNAYVADAINHTIRKISPAGVATTIAGHAQVPGATDGSGAEARLYSPRSVAADAVGNVYVAEDLNHTIRRITADGVVSTLAGQAGISGSADGGGTNALFNLPRGIALNSSGTIYVADQGNGRVRKIAPDGTVTTLALTFSGPEGLAVDSTGILYVADWIDDRVWKVATNGVRTVFSSNAQPRLDDPTGLAVDAANNVYVTDTHNYVIRKFTPAGVASIVAGTPFISGSADGNGSAARFNSPRGIAVDHSGNLLIADSNNNTIRKVAPDGTVTTLAGLGGGNADGSASTARFNFPEGIAADPAGTLYIADTQNHTIRKIAPSGVVTTLAGSPTWRGSTNGVGNEARFNAPEGVAADGAGNVYVADTLNHIIRKITSDGAVTTLAGAAGSSGSADGQGAVARFFLPQALAVDGTGNVYVASGSSIRKITPDGTVSTLAGQSGASGATNGVGSNALFNYPAGVAVDVSGHVYVADSFNHTIRKITPEGMVTTVAGLAGSSGSVDGVASEARFSYPAGIATDSAGIVYVADNSSHTIRRIAAGGMVTTVAGLAGVRGEADGFGSDARFYAPRSIAVDAAGTVYIVDWFNHSLRSGVPAPRLLIGRSVGQVILSWPTSATGMVLQANGQLEPGSTWSSITEGIFTSGNQFIFTNNAASDSRYYRLIKP